ncbi:MAG: hypothetical protein II997_01200 [Clostridia bacterium]|nr:hypothetical protein [Clostridia bacterium]
MKKHFSAAVQSMHWAARLTIKSGTTLALLVLFTGYFFPRFSFLAIASCETAVYLFALALCGGFLMDVIAERTGLRE